MYMYMCTCSTHLARCVHVHVSTCTCRTQGPVYNVYVCSHGILQYKYTCTCIPRTCTHTSVHVHLYIPITLHFTNIQGYMSCRSFPSYYSNMYMYEFTNHRHILHMYMYVCSNHHRNDRNALLCMGSYARTQCTHTLHSVWAEYWEAVELLLSAMHRVMPATTTSVHCTCTLCMYAAQLVKHLHSVPCLYG